MFIICYNIQCWICRLNCTETTFKVWLHDLNEKPKKERHHQQLDIWTSLWNLDAACKKTKCLLYSSRQSPQRQPAAWVGHWAIWMRWVGCRHRAEGLGWARPRRMDKGSDCAKNTILSHPLLCLIIKDNMRLLKYKKQFLITTRYS